MESLISTFHLDLKLFLAQVVNFAIVFAVLYFWAIKPLFKVMAERNGKIDEGLKRADEAVGKLEEADEKQKIILSDAKKQAAELLKEARAQSEIRKTEMIADARAEIGKAIEQEKRRLDSEKAVILEAIKKEAADYILAAARKLIDVKADEKSDAELIKKLVK